MLFSQKKKKQNSPLENISRGFTLIEIMVSVALFTIVVTVSMGALLTVVDTNRKAQTLQLVMNNLNFAVESMVRELREATSYTVSPESQIEITRTKENGIDRERVTFLLTNGEGDIGVLTRQENVDGIPTPESLTSEGIDIKSLRFETTGERPDRVVIIITGRSTITKAGTESTFSIQTTVAQRN